MLSLLQEPMIAVGRHQLRRDDALVVNSTRGTSHTRHLSLTLTTSCLILTKVGLGQNPIELHRAPVSSGEPVAVLGKCRCQQSRQRSAAGIMSCQCRHQCLTSIEAVRAAKSILETGPRHVGRLCRTHEKCLRPGVQL